MDVLCERSVSLRRALLFVLARHLHNMPLLLRLYTQVPTLFSLGS
jgi:hypothetical protein